MSTGKEGLSPAEIDARLQEFEHRIEELKHEYEMYFNGISRRPPETLFKQVSRLHRQLEYKTFIRNTAQKFRLRSLVQRFSSYKQYWERIRRQIEEGTYVRDIKKAQRRQQRQEEREDVPDAFDLDLDMDAIDNLDMFAQQVSDDIATRREQPAPAPQPVPAHPAAPAAPQPARPTANFAERPKTRADKIRELQAKLGIPATGEVDSAPRPAAVAQAAQPSAAEHDSRKDKLAAMKRRLESRTRGQKVRSGAEQAGVSGGQAVRGASVDRLKQLRADKDRIERMRASGGQKPARQAPAGNQRRVIQRHKGGGDDDQVRKVYRNLIEAKKRCNESTNNLSYESVARSMKKQRDRMRETHGARDVDFKVVIKDGKAFLKPEPK